MLSAGAIHERRDREVKRKLYSLKGVQEYWIVDWRLQPIEIYRRGNNQLQLMATLLVADDISSPLLPGFQCQVNRLV